jgi:hypothetical protein
MKRNVLLLGILLSGSLLTAQAQADSARLYQKAEELLTAMKMPELYSLNINGTVQQQVAANPMLANYRPEVKALLEKWIGWPIVKKDIEKCYLQYFSPKEMDELIHFYHTAAGQKIALRGADLMKDMVRVEQTMLQPHMPEWSQFVTQKKYASSQDANK